VQGDLGDAGRIRGVSLAATAAAEQPGPGGQGGWHVPDLFTGGGQLLGDGSSQPVGALDGEPPDRPPSGPGQKLAERTGSVPALTSSRRWPSGLPEGSIATAVSEALWGSIPMVITASAPMVAGTGTRRGGHSDLQNGLPCLCRATPRRAPASSARC
jgi:hypothetical protein